MYDPLVSQSGILIIKPSQKNVSAAHVFTVSSLINLKYARVDSLHYLAIMGQWAHSASLSHGNGNVL